MQLFISGWKSFGKALTIVLLMAGLLTACQKNSDLNPPNEEITSNEKAAVADAEKLEQTAARNAESEGKALGLSNDQSSSRHKSNIVEIAVSNPHFSSLVAAVLKTGLAGALSNAEANLTVFAPTNEAFKKLPAPFNNAHNIGQITDQKQIDFLKNVLLYHVLGAEVFSYEIERGRSNATTLKSKGTANDNTVYFSKTFGLIRINGQTDIIWANLNASNGVIHVINKVLLPPSANIAQIAIGDANFGSLVAALVKTNLAGVFTGDGDFTVFAPTNDAFAKLPAPFNSAANISAITNQGQIDALANILKYHVIGSRYFNWDLGILAKVTTLANAPGNKITTILGYNTGWVKGDANNNFSRTNPGDILATNGVIHVIGDVLLPK
jgi:uncharacterized surface protein with fasciclin (FAS1) repeats